ncbi:MAG: Fic family protein, partial [Gammaproteobacteria bacterium]
RAYLFTETDANDLTYFIDFNLSVILRAIKKLQRYLSVKAREIQRVEAVLGYSMLYKSLNHRQIALISHAIHNPGAIYTIESHKASHRITYPTARSDLLRLAELRLVEKRKIRRTFVFVAIENVEARLSELKAQGY